MAELHDLTLLEQAAAVRGREVSPVDLVDHYLARIDRLNETVGAFVHVAPDLARAAAKDAASAVTSGADLPPLHGVPTAIKDLYLTADMPTSGRGP
jgi:amidase